MVLKAVNFAKLVRTQATTYGEFFELLSDKVCTVKQDHVCTASIKKVAKPQRTTIGE